MLESLETSSLVTGEAREIFSRFVLETFPNIVFPSKPPFCDLF